MRIEMSRLARAVHLTVEHLGAYSYRVIGGAEPHLVDLLEPQECTCPDALNRPALACSHLLAVMLHNGDRDCLRSLRYWVPFPRADRLIRAA